MCKTEPHAGRESLGRRRAILVGKPGGAVTAPRFGHLGKACAETLSATHSSAGSPAVAPPSSGLKPRFDRG